MSCCCNVFGENSKEFWRLIITCEGFFGPEQVESLFGKKKKKKKKKN